MTNFHAFIFNSRNGFNVQCLTFSVTFSVLLADRRWWKVMAQETWKQHQRCSTAVERFTTGAGERTSIQYEATNWGQQDATRNTDCKNGRYFNVDDLGSGERPTTLQLPQLLGGLTKHNQRKQPTFSDATTGFPAKWRLRNERRNSTLMTLHYPDLGSSSDWLCHAENLL